MIMLRDSSNYHDSCKRLEDKIINNSFVVDSINFKFYSLKSKRYLDFYNTIVTFEDDYRKNLLEYDSLLKYLSENIHDDMEALELDSLDIKELNKIQLPPNMKNNILPDINIDINIKPNNE